MHRRLQLRHLYLIVGLLASLLGPAGRAYAGAPIVPADMEVVGLEDEPLIITLPGSDPDGDALDFYIRTSAQIGSLYQVNADGTRGELIPTIRPGVLVTNPDHQVWYEPLPNQNGRGYDKFSYYIVDSTGDRSADFSEVDIHIEPGNDPPFAKPMSYSGHAQDQEFMAISMNFDDIDFMDQWLLEVHFTQLPTNGTLYPLRGADPITTDTVLVDSKVVIYRSATWPQCVASEDSFSYYVEDPAGVRTEVVTNTIKLEAGTCRPTQGATPSQVTTPPNTPVEIEFQPAVTWDVGGIEIVTPPQHGTLSFQLLLESLDPTLKASEPTLFVGPRSPKMFEELHIYPDQQGGVFRVTYTPDPDFTTANGATESFTYRVLDRGVTQSRWSFDIPLQIVVAGDMPRPAKPTIRLALNHFNAGQDAHATYSSTPMFMGTARAGETVSVYADGASTPLCSGVAIEPAHWSCTATSALTAGPHTITAVATSSAGAATSDPFSLTILTTTPADTTAPTTSAQATTGDGAAYTFDTWTKQDVTVHLDASDGTGNVSATYYRLDNGSQQTYDAATGIAIAAAGSHSVTFWSVDGAGNVETQRSVNVKIDKTAPAIQASATTADGNAYSGRWTLQDVIVHFTCDDQAGLSGLKSCPDDVRVSAEGASQSVEGTAEDNAGNTQRTTFGPINIDRTPPTTRASATLGNDGTAYTFDTWTNQDVHVLLRADDGTGSGVNQTHFIVNNVEAYGAITTQGSHHVLFWSDDGVGLVETAQSVQVKIDKTAPVIQASATTADGNAYTGGWTNQDVIVHFWCADGEGLSGLKSCSEDVRVSAEGAGQSVEGTAEDNAGNTQRTTFGPINIDRTPPQISVSAPTNDATYLLNQAVPASYGCADLLADGVTPGSGSATCAGSVANGSTLNTSSVGNKTFTVNATDNAGNQAQAVHVAYRVAYKINLLYDTTQSRPPGILVQLQNAAGTNVSSSSIAVTALSIVDSNGNTVKTLNSAFTFSDKGPAGTSGGVYIYKLSTGGLKSGAYTLRFKAGNDPVVHEAPFRI